jgi:DNA-binding response OmpR family regulator
MRRKILAVDDDAYIVRLVKLTLERAGYEVVTALDGRDAAALVDVERPDLIICDVMMPRMSGFDLLRRLRSEPGTSSIPLIMLTARGGDTDVSDGWALGVDTYLSKPFSPEELLAFVSRLLPVAVEEPSPVSVSDASLPTTAE